MLVRGQHLHSWIEDERMPVRSTLAAPRAAGAAAAEATAAVQSAAPPSVAVMGTLDDLAASTAASMTAGNARACATRPSCRGYLICTGQFPEMSGPGQAVSETGRSAPYTAQLSLWLGLHVMTFDTQGD